MTDKLFELNKPYWSYYVDLSNKRNKLRDYCGVFQITPIERTLQYNKYYYYRWNVEGKGNFPYPMNHNIDNRLNDGRNIFETREEAIKAHDEQISEWAKNQNTEDRARMVKKLIQAQGPAKKQIEIDSIAWYDKLTAKEKKYVKWIKDFYEEI